MPTRLDRVRSRRNCHPPGIALLLLATTSALAGPGDLDPTFGAGGRVIVDLPDGASSSFNTVEAGTAVLQQPDGKLLIGRKLYYWNASEDLAVVRMNVNGQLDTTFSGDGRTSVAIPNLNGSTQALLYQADGRIVAVGGVSGSSANPSPTARLGIARYLASGSVDTSFGNSGVVLESFGFALAEGVAVVQQQNGRLVVGGYVESDTGVRDMLLARFNADGSLDSTFGTAGSRVIDFMGEQRRDRVRALALQPDGKLLVLGDARDGRTAKVVVLRMMPDGSLDATFGQGGFANAPLLVLPPMSLLSSAVAAGTLHLQADGKIVLGAQLLSGNVNITQNCTGVVARLNANGTPDVTFGDSDGVARLPLGTCFSVAENSIALGPDGSVLVANTSPNVGDVIVERLTPAGQIDNTFGVAGSAIVDIAVDAWRSYAEPEIGVRLLRDSDGRMVVVASDGFDWDFGGNYFVVARLLATGSSAGLIGVRYPSVVVNETDANATFTVRRTGGSTGTVSVDYAITADTAVDGVDFASASGTLNWADGDSANKEIQIRILDDSRSDGVKSARVVLSNATEGASFSSSRGSLLIEDNEPSVQPPAPVPPPPASASPRSDSGGGASGWTLLGLLAFVLSLRRSMTRRASAMARFRNA